MVATLHVPEAGTVEAEITERIRALYDAWRDRDEARSRTFFSESEGLLLWGTDAWERILGRAEADQEFKHWTASCPPWTAIESTHRTIGFREDLAWVADEVIGTWRSAAENGQVPFRITTIWEKQGGEWRLLHANFATPH